MLWTAFTFIAVTCFSLGITRLLLVFLQKHAIFDHPNERSSHTRPTPRGGGIAVVFSVIVSWSIIFLWLGAPTHLLWLLSGAFILALISWWDDLKNLSQLTRLGFQLAVAAIYIWQLHIEVFQGLLPQPMDNALAALAWVWFINLFNFMDGIDEISAIESFGIGIGILTILGLSQSNAWRDPGASELAAAALLGAVAGFWWWNRHPAKIFLGDVGSIPLGFVLGGWLLTMAADGYWAPALILPAYYWIDATFTLLKRIARREAFWQPHRNHIYQQAVQRGRSHRQVAWSIGLINLVLITISVFWMRESHWSWLMASVLIVALHMRWLMKSPKHNTNNSTLSESKPTT